jgi:hypothetical protein
MGGTMTDMLGALRELLKASARFEKRAAHHRRVEGDRQALREALARAQLVLSITERQPAAHAVGTVAEKPLREKAPTAQRRRSKRL